MELPEESSPADSDSQHTQEQDQQRSPLEGQERPKSRKPPSKATEGSGNKLVFKAITRSTSSKQMKRHETTKIEDKESIGEYVHNRMSNIELMEQQILMEPIGKGGYGAVFKGLHKHQGNFVAIKKISLSKTVKDDHLNSLMVRLWIPCQHSSQTEINLLQRLKHRNIVKYVDHVLSKRSIYIVME